MEERASPAGSTDASCCRPRGAWFTGSSLLRWTSTRRGERRRREGGQSRAARLQKKKTARTSKVGICRHKLQGVRLSLLVAPRSPSLAFSAPLSPEECEWTALLPRQRQRLCRRRQRRQRQEEESEAAATRPPSLLPSPQQQRPSPPERLSAASWPLPRSGGTARRGRPSTR